MSKTRSNLKVENSANRSHVNLKPIERKGKIMSNDVDDHEDIFTLGHKIEVLSQFVERDYESNEVIDPADQIIIDEFKQQFPSWRDHNDAVKSLIKKYNKLS